MKKHESIITADLMEFLFQAKERNQTIEAQIVALDFPDDTPTWILSFPQLDGVKGLVPASEAGVPKNLMPRFVGQEIRVKVKGLDRENGLVACSHREALADASEKLLPELARDPERTWDGTVRAVLPPDPESGKPVRLLVDVGGVLAEVPRREAAVWLTKPLGAQYTPGQKVKVKITRVDQQTGIVEASVKKALPDPWERADFRRGQFISATVSHIYNGIVFLEPDAAPGVLGIAPVPIMGEVKRGDRVSCAVASFAREKKKLHLRLRGRLA